MEPKVPNLPNKPGSLARNMLAVVATEIVPTPPESFIIEPPKKFATPVPKIVSVRPVTFWFTFWVTVKNAYSKPANPEATIVATKVRIIETKGFGFTALFS